MHIPDGFLSIPVWGTMDAIALPSVAYIARRAQREFDHHRIPLMGVMGAFVFAAQMINFPVGNGTSGHLVGGALLAFTLGPAAASIVMTAILATQALVFQDGGLLALGANVFNMAIAGVLAGYLPYALLRGRKAGVFLGGMFSLHGQCGAGAGRVTAVGRAHASGSPDGFDRSFRRFRDRGRRHHAGDCAGARSDRAGISAAPEADWRTRRAGPRRGVGVSCRLGRIHCIGSAGWNPETRRTQTGITSPLADYLTTVSLRLLQ